MINLWARTQGFHFRLGKFFFGAVKFNKNYDPDKCKYSGYCIGIDAHGSFSMSNVSGFSKNVKYVVLI